MKVRIPKGDGPGNMQAMLRQAQKMQEQMEVLRAELDERTYDIKAGGGAVQITITGRLEVTALTIDPSLIDPDDPETLTDVVMAGINQAIKTVNETNDAEMSAISESAGLPGMM